jgi:hypothetical protein
MLVAIWLMPPDWPANLRRPRWLLIGLSTALAITIWLLVISDYRREDMRIGFQLLFLPYLFSGVAAFLIQAGLRKPKRLGWFVPLGLVMFLAVALSLAEVAGYGGLGTVFAFLTAVATGGVALVAAIWMLWSLEGWRKSAAVLAGVLFPLSLFLSVRVGDSNSPENITERNGAEIIAALDNYYQSEGVYPNSLSDLLPDHFLSLPDALTRQGTGWLYDRTDTGFILGYWRWPEKMGADVCLYQSVARYWNCELNNWGPFRPVETSTPPWPYPTGTPTQPAAE